MGFSSVPPDRTKPSASRGSTTLRAGETPPPMHGWPSGIVTSAANGTMDHGRWVRCGGATKRLHCLPIVSRERRERPPSVRYSGATVHAVMPATDL